MLLIGQVVQRLADACRFVCLAGERVGDVANAGHIAVNFFGHGALLFGSRGDLQVHVGDHCDGLANALQRGHRLLHLLRTVLRLAAGRKAQPSAAILDSRTLRSTPESGARAGYDGAKRKQGAKLHLAVDTLGHLLALHVTAANADDRGEVGRLAQAVQASTGQSVELAYVDQGYTGARAADAARANGIELEVVKLPEAKRGFVLLPRRWVVERSFAWATRFRRLVKDYERYASTLADLHLVAFVCLMLKQAALLAAGP